MKKYKKFDRVNTRFGTITVLEVKEGKIKVLIDEEIIATFNLVEFDRDFVLK